MKFELLLQRSITFSDARQPPPTSESPPPTLSHLLRRPNHLLRRSATSCDVQITSSVVQIASSYVWSAPPTSQYLLLRSAATSSDVPLLPPTFRCLV
ncbi:hypothetical protein LINPERHAP2_LOCUS28876 [Linum perenne]